MMAPAFLRICLRALSTYVPYAVAEEIGIDREMAAEYVADEEGTSFNYEVLSDMAMELRISERHTVESTPLERIRRYKENQD